ncbi:hypothetical protein ACFRJ9_02695 [Paenarthrobacter sp. NPDC056912]|uniref:hypothetical protein n=1 Tax=Paenarthrobacter sp. NPDC056912 TaxID=3345965 RepID=UPI0036703A97
MQKARVAAVLTWVYAAAFGIPAIPVGIYLLQNGYLPMFMDLFPMYAGPWDGLQSWAFVALLLAFLVVVLAASWAAWLAWRGLKSGLVVGLALLPVEAVFWLGFDLPFPWLFGVARGLLYALALRSLRQRPDGRLAGG